jgi:hypothetical protein
MSYCRFSSDDFASDIYCFEHCDGYFQIYVAGNRVVPCEPFPPRVEMTAANVDAYVARHQEVMRILDASLRAEIGLPYDGESFSLPDAATCADQLEFLRGIGYNVPQFAIDTLREEAAEAVKG